LEAEGALGPVIGWSDDWFSAVGFPWHPHRGFQTVTLVLDGLLEHRDNEGELTAGGETLTANSWAWFDAGEAGPTELPLDAVAASRFVVVSAAPIGAPIVTHGPFVMNTEAEIVEAIEDFNAGRFGPVPTDVVTDPRARAR
jgi:redox-sensitive bicupin YhaK (pirin superfamily)